MAKILLFTAGILTVWIPYVAVHHFSAQLTTMEQVAGWFLGFAICWRLFGLKITFH